MKLLYIVILYHLFEVNLLNACIYLKFIFNFKHKLHCMSTLHCMPTYVKFNYTQLILCVDIGLHNKRRLSTYAFQLWSDSESTTMRILKSCVFVFFFAINVYIVKSGKKSFFSFFFSSMEHQRLDEIT